MLRARLSLARSSIGQFRNVGLREDPDVTTRSPCDAPPEQTRLLISDLSLTTVLERLNERVSIMSVPNQFYEYVEQHKSDFIDRLAKAVAIPSSVLGRFSPLLALPLNRR